jgi:phage portal protein BeeE
MVFWDRANGLVSRAEINAEITRAAAANPAPHMMTAGLVPSWSDFSEFAELSAMQIPAFTRGLRLITGTVAQLPLVQWRDGQRVTNPFFAQPEPDRTAWVSMQRTTRDLVLRGRAYWLVLATDAAGYPARVRVLDAGDVSENLINRDHVTIKGKDYPVSHPAGPGTNVGSVIVFTGYKDGVLVVGRDAIDTALAIEDAARNIANSPLPSVVLKNNGADLSREEVLGLLTDWEASRRERATAYLNSVISADAMGWNSAELQLVEARNISAVQIARVLGLDPMWVGAGVSGSSITYANRVDARKDLIGLTLTDYMVPIEQRLSMRDCTPTVTNNRVRFDTAEFLRASVTELTGIISTLLPLGVIDVERAQSILADNGDF